MRGICAGIFGLQVVVCLFVVWQRIQREASGLGSMKNMRPKVNNKREHRQEMKEGFARKKQHEEKGTS